MMSLIAWATADGTAVVVAEAAGCELVDAAGVVGVGWAGDGEAWTSVGVGGVVVGETSVDASWLCEAVDSAVGVDRSSSRRVGTPEHPARIIAARTTTVVQAAARFIVLSPI
jgi:hypothetical protein